MRTRHPILTLIHAAQKTPIRDQYREDEDWKRYTKGLMKCLKTQDDAIAELSILVVSVNCALLCYEADSNFCHHSMVANAAQRLLRCACRTHQSSG